ncbi:TetR/AcrR family transcriptional regulator [Rhodococcus sp. UNC363MFTsu5.1]|uniref:TetR/AcrR family transcriptional regulator n=1 Tax=Rhodococcus sp. UNC363MFTsu5.1 TaxID=1449069 RepID=UPI00068A97EE|nr:TetR/AcrR family transcriptional regulator [Rhodococcus sp. UNC363MFTsu5.1]
MISTRKKAQRTPSRRGAGESLRTDILAAAAEMLGETGDVDAVSLRGVARRVGVTPTSIYLHFADREELHLAVKQLRFEEFAAVLQAAAEAAGDDPGARLRAMGHAYVRYGLANPGHYRVLFVSNLRHQAGEKLADSHAHRAILLITEEVGRYLGLPAVAKETVMLALHLWSATHGMVALRLAQARYPHADAARDPWPDAHEQIDNLADLLLPKRGA